MKKNKGYTLVEMLIVIAIMAIVSGMAFVTIGIIYQAKYNAAIDSLNTQIDSLWVKTKALSQGRIQILGHDSVADSSDIKSIYPLCMMLKENTEDDDVKDGCYELILGYEDGNNFVEKEVVSVLTNIININYKPSSASQKHPKLTKESTKVNGETNESTSQILLEFNKSDGSVKYGAGTYEIIYNDRIVGTVYLDATTGNHYIK
ncbi:MAG: prepilin-type N-terminal cleavage/methylation domain-containing protein [Lachnospiraceae bacterium]|nr:prepilin-type N-terminal cleavage/methylation domain-containing protein [Lachnospiraceae bacterium]